MKKSILLTVVVAFINAATAFAGGEATWSYSGDTGPDKWGELSPSFQGRNNCPMVKGKLCAISLLF